MATAVGCGMESEGPKRFTVKGTVTYKGTPVPVGMVRLSPDTSKGNQGPGAIAEIKDGHFSTITDKGAVAGPMLVYVEGYDGVPLSKNTEIRDLGKSLFDQYKKELVIPAEDLEIEIEVPERGGRTF